MSGCVPAGRQDEGVIVAMRHFGGVEVLDEHRHARTTSGWRQPAGPRVCGAPGRDLDRSCASGYLHLSYSLSVVWLLFGAGRDTRRMAAMRHHALLDQNTHCLLPDADMEQFFLEPWRVTQLCWVFENIKVNRATRHLQNWPVLCWTLILASDRLYASLASVAGITALCESYAGRSSPHCVMVSS